MPRLPFFSTVENALDSNERFMRTVVTDQARAQAPQPESQETRSERRRRRRERRRQNRNGAAGRPPHPEAAPAGPMTFGLPDVVTGVAVVDRDFSQSVTRLLEVVTPDGSPLASHSAAQWHAAEASTTTTAADAEQIFGQRPTFLSAGTMTLLPTKRQGTQAASPTTPSPSLPSSTPDEGTGNRTGCESNPRKAREVLDGGCYVLFSDDFVEAHGDTVVASLTEKYRHAVPNTAEAREPVFIDPEWTERQKRLAVLRHYVKQAEQRHRPLFRRRNSFSVYGRADYTAPLERSEEEEVEVEAETASEGEPSDVPHSAPLERRSPTPPPTVSL